MQNAKDTFYEVLRVRLAAINPERTIVLRGVVRPGLLVVENELESAVAIPDCFRVQWIELSAERDGLLTLTMLQCVIEYETAGTVGNAGMDRGRALSAMDAELLSAVEQAPWIAAKTDYSALSYGGVAKPMTTNIWWGPVVFGKLAVEGDRILRSATVALMSYQEAGEL
jgi:hypothetical protein